MKRVINARLFDTDEAEVIGEFSYGNSGDFHAWEESLYRTKRGAYFIAGSGGARSKYGRQISQNTWSGGDGMETLSAADALSWCERHHIDADVISQHFEIEQA